MLWFGMLVAGEDEAVFGPFRVLVGYSSPRRSMDRNFKRASIRFDGQDGTFTLVTVQCQPSRARNHKLASYIHSTSFIQVVSFYLTSF